MDSFRNLRVWLVHDWLTGFRGGEKILLELTRMFPRARIATLLHISGASHPELDRRVALTSVLQKIPGIRKNYRHFLPLFPAAVRSLHLDGECDLALSVSHAVAKGVIPPKNIPHLCYCNTPMRYIWGLEDQYLPRFSPRRLALAAVSPGLRRFDRRTENVTQFIGNSENVAARIRRIYRRDARVVYAGIDQDFFTPTGQQREDFFPVRGALVPYKRIDLAIAAFRAFAAHPRRRLVIIGSGPDESRLRRIARGSPRIQFLGRNSDEVLRDHYRRCRAFVFPGVEDFGLTPVEAQACGAPVIAFRAGGLLETVCDSAPSPTGIFYEDQFTGLPGALDRFDREEHFFDPAAIRLNALRFSWQNFREGIYSAIREILPAQFAAADSADSPRDPTALCV